MRSRLLAGYVRPDEIAGYAGWIFVQLLGLGANSYTSNPRGAGPHARIICASEREG